MTEHVATPVPAVPGIDLSFRPRTYFGPLPLKTHLLAHVTGQERRELLRARLATVCDDLPADLIASTLDAVAREAIGRIHPSFMGGEYLPPLNDHEIEIARISLESTIADQISVRAERIPDGIAYRIVDEYPEDGPRYECKPERSVLPVTLAELVGMVDNSLEGGGAAMSHLLWNLANGAHHTEMRNFVHVTSEFYPQLSTYYARRIELWFEANFPRRPGLSRPWVHVIHRVPTTAGCWCPIDMRNRSGPPVGGPPHPSSRTGKPKSVAVPAQPGHASRNHSLKRFFMGKKGPSL